MIYFMDTETLTESFTKDHDWNEILETNFVLVSNRIHYQKTDNIIHSSLYDEKIIFAMYGSKEDYNIIRNSIEKSDKKIFELIGIISKSMILNERFILLTTKSEMNTGYLKTLSEIIEDMFEYPIIDYKKDRYKSFTYHPSRVGKNIKYYEDNVLKKILTTPIGREKAVEYMTKKEMKKILKKKGLYSKAMSKSDMKDMLKVFYVEER